MKLLVLYQAKDAAADQPGYHDGFEQLVTEGVLTEHSAIPYYGVSAALGWNGLWNSAYETALRMRADAVFLQFFHGPIPNPTAGIQQIKSLPNKPTVFTSLGDPFGRWTKRVPDSFRKASALADISFLTGMGYLAKQLAQAGSRNLVLMPNGCCQVRFAAPPDSAACNPEFGVAFVGNRMGSLNPASHFFWVGRKREELVSSFTRRYGRAFGLFGNGWAGNPSWQGSVPYAHQQETYRRSAVVLGGLPNAYHDYYTSDRAFIAAGSGSPFVDYWVRGVDAILKPERDWWLASDITGLLKCCDKLLDLSETERHALGRQARARVLASHTHFHRCREMVAIVKDFRNARVNGTKAKMPKLEFLAHDKNAVRNFPAPVVAWQG